MPDQGALGPFFHGWRLHIDGGAAPNPGRMAVGAWLCGPDGQVHTLSMMLPGTGCNNEAELRALTEALPWAARHGATQVQLYTDSTVLVALMDTSDTRKVTRLQALIQEARRLMMLHQVRGLQWVPRHRNAQADALARSALGLPPKAVKTPHPARRRR